MADSVYDIFFLWRETLRTERPAVLQGHWNICEQTVWAPCYSCQSLYVLMQPQHFVDRLVSIRECNVAESAR